MDRPIDTQVRRHRLTRRIGIGALIVASVAGGDDRRAPAAAADGGAGAVADGAGGTGADRGDADGVGDGGAGGGAGDRQPGGRAGAAHPQAAGRRAATRARPILDLDLSASQLAVQKLEQDLAIKQNQQAKTRLDLEARLADLEGQREVKALELGAQRARTSRDQQLNANGFLSKDELDQSVLTEARVAAELKKLESEIRHARLSNQTQVAGLALERATVQRDRDEARRVLDLATTKADRKAVLTWTVTEEGAAVKKGDILARAGGPEQLPGGRHRVGLHAQRVAGGAAGAGAGRASSWTRPTWTAPSPASSRR